MLQAKGWSECFQVICAFDYLAALLFFDKSTHYFATA
jgi:hypothetical protein